MDDDLYPSSDDGGELYSDVEIEEAYENEIVEDNEVSLDSRNSSTQVITKESLLAAQREDLHRVMELLPLTEHHARTLLIHHRWDVDRLLAVLVEKGRDQLFADAGVTVLQQRSSTLVASSSSVITCNICFEDFSSEATTTMECGHGFCNDCWTEHFIVKINDGQSRHIRCMAPDCKAVCDETIVRTLVSAKRPELADKFERFLLESYIEDNKKVKWCPSIPHCGNAIRVDGDDIYCEVECTCGQQFCFSCLSEAHSPCSCSMWEIWVKKCRDESENANWITVHTKPCPKCHKHVEKNGGCNLVTCVCGQHFCWLCGGATGREHTWTRISGHSCGRYKEDEMQKSERAKFELHRYLHYYNRYKLHMDSFKLESKLMTTIQEKISISENRDSQIRDYSWVVSGLGRLFRSRRVLAYSYPFAHCMFGNELFRDELTPEEKDIKKNLFEDLQQQLECNVERLSKLLEEPFDEFSEDKVLETRLHMINLSVLVDNLCLKMYQCIENDLLGALRGTIHNIAPYKSKGVERALELSISRGSEPTSMSSIKTAEIGASPCWDSDVIRSGETVGPSEHGLRRLASATTGDGSCPRQKRLRRDSGGDCLFDLNVPPNMADKI